MKLLDAALVKILARELALYPVGSTVRLSTGETARVIGSSREPDRPWVGVILDDGGKRPTAPRILDLSRFPGLHIRSETTPFEETLAGF
jgi:hypothetical protein